MDAAGLVDCSVPILDVSAGLSAESLSSRELDYCLKGSPSPRYSLSPFGLLLMDRRVYVPEYRPERGSFHTRGLQAKHNHPNGRSFRLQQNTGVTTSPLRLAQHADGPQEVRLTVRPVRSQHTLSRSSLRLAAAFASPRAPMALYQYGLCRAFTPI